MAAQFQFVMRSGPNTGQIYRLEASEIIVGRDASNSVAINDGEVSRKHARLTLHGSAYVIQDLGSTNGTFINGQRITGSQVLNIGDTVSFGEHIVLIYEAALDPNATVISSAQIPRTVTPVQRPAPAPVSAYTPAPTPTPVYTPPPAPVSAYSGQVPVGPIPMTVQPKKKKTGMVIGIIIAVIVLICICSILFAWMAPQTLLCAPGIRIISNLIGPLFGYGVCP
jgi:predicted component of type VI protein secretion system